MRPDQRSLVLDLGVGVDGRRRKSPEEFLAAFGANDGEALGRDLLMDSVSRRDGEDLALATVVCSTFGYGPDLVEVLSRLIREDWHERHEDVVTALNSYADPAALDALYEATQWIPEYLEFDDSRALAKKAIWAIGRIPGPEADQVLLRLVESGDKILVRCAREQLDRRAS